MGTQNLFDFQLELAGFLIFGKQDAHTLGAAA
jgi:hypothetical protein